MSLADVQLHLVNDLETANDMMRWLGERHYGEIAFDTETSGLDTVRDHVRLCQIGDAMHGWAIPWVQWGGVFLEALKKYKDGPFIAHNLMYDVAMIRHTCGYQMPQDRCHDTMLMARVLAPTYSAGLKQVAARLVDPAAGGLQDQLGNSLNKGWTWATVPLDYEPYWTYAALDTVLTSRVDMVLRPQLEQLGVTRSYELELAASWVCERMQMNGIMVDRQYAMARLHEFRTHAQALSDWCKEWYGVRPSANADVAQRLMADGIMLPKETESGAVALDKEVLGPIDHPLAQAVLEHRKYSKRASAYIRHFVELTSDEDPRLRPRINSCEARTGRMSMDTPSLHNLPRRDESDASAIAVRNCFIAPPENVLLMIDYDQIELRFLAHLSGDEGLKLAFRNADQVDFFTAAARSMFNEPEMPKKDHRRQTTKNAFYAKGYGAGATKFAATAGLSPQDGQAVYDAIDVSFPGVSNLGRMVTAKAMQRLQTEGVAYAKSPLTGRRHPADDDRMYTLVNYLVQGAAAELLKMKLIELDNAGFGPYMCLPIHDEVVFDVPRDQVNEFAKAACEVMADANLLTVPITVGPSIGDRWGEKQDYEIT
jgi:DNA polymerase-1